MASPDPGSDSAARQRKRAIEAEIASQRRAVLVVNTQSRRGRQLFASAKLALLAGGLTLDAAYAVRNAARLPGIVSGLVDAGHRLVIVGGGDGTISSVADSFAHRDAVLAVLPVGTANSFARTAGIPLALEEAVKVAVAGKVADIDLGVVNGHHFANAAAIGLPASIARHMPRTAKRWLGRLGYLLVAVARLVRHRPFRCSLVAGGQRTNFEAMEVRIANGQYQGGVRVADAAHVESRDLVVQSIVGRSRLSIARFWSRAVTGSSPSEGAEVHVLRAAEFVLETDPPQYVSIDGEPVTRTPLHARVARQALLLRVPRDQPEIQ